MVTKGEAGIDGMHPDETGRLRMQEEINSARVVGVESVEFLDCADGVVGVRPPPPPRHRPRYPKVQARCPDQRQLRTHLV